VPPGPAPVAGSASAKADLASADSAGAPPSAGAARSQDSTEANNAFRRAAQIGDLGRLAALRAQQTNIDARDGSGRTALMLAVQQGQAQAVAELLDYGADPNVPDFAGRTPLAVALASGQSAVVALLQHNGARERLSDSPE
jgi:ankyrin repeat protein